jgi:hypothetical protein
MKLQSRLNTLSHVALHLSLTALLIHDRALAQDSPVPTPLRGTYVPTQGNAPSICPQELRPRIDPATGSLVSIKVAYVGECEYMGPYTYPCSLSAPIDQSPARQWVCGEWQIWFHFESPNRYLWENRAYGFKAVFEPSL